MLCKSVVRKAVVESGEVVVMCCNDVSHVL
jgi:hypothetical protein